MSFAEGIDLVGRCVEVVGILAIVIGIAVSTAHWLSRLQQPSAYNDAEVGSSTAQGVVGFFEDDATAEDVHGFCDGYCRRPIGGSLRVEDSDLVDLEDLACVPKIVGELVIRDNPSLRTLSGLSSLDEIGGDLAIVNNAVLEDVSALYGLCSVGGDLVVAGNPALPEEAIDTLAGTIVELGGDIVDEDPM